VTGQHLLLLLWTLWLVFALLSIGDLLGVILALVFGLLGVGLVLTGLAMWRGYVIAWLIVHVLVAGYAVAVLRGWLRPASGRLGLRTLWNWPQNALLQTIFGSVSFVGLVSVLYLRPTVPWMYRADIPLMILVVLAVVAAEYALLAGSRRFKYPLTPEPQDQESEQQDSEPERSQAGSESGADPAATNGDPPEEKVVPPEEPADAGEEIRERINGLEFGLTNVDNILQQQVRDALAYGALESEPPVWFHASGEVGTGAQSDEPTPGMFSVELLRIARLTMHQKGSIGMADRVVVDINGMANRVVGITIERRTVPISLEPGEKVSQVIARAAEPDTAQPISPRGWEVVSARWVQVGLTGVNTAARTAADLDAGLDSILHNEPVRPVFSWNAPGSAAAVIGKVAENKETLQIGGIVVRTRSGQPVAVSACFWSLARDDLTRSLAAGIARALGTIGLSRVPTPSSKHKQAASLSFLASPETQARAPVG
jgi:hypothetical protein